MHGCHLKAIRPMRLNCVDGIPLQLQGRFRIETRLIISLMIFKQGLHLGFSWYCPSSLDLPNFVVRSCRGAAAELCPASGRQAGYAEIWESGDPEIWKSGNPEFWNLEIWKFGIPKHPQTKNSQNQNPFCPKCRQGLD